MDCDDILSFIFISVSRSRERNIFDLAILWEGGGTREEMKIVGVLRRNHFKLGDLFQSSKRFNCFRPSGQNGQISNSGPTK